MPTVFFLLMTSPAKIGPILHQLRRCPSGHFRHIAYSIEVPEAELSQAVPGRSGVGCPRDFPQAILEMDAKKLEAVENGYLC